MPRAEDNPDPNPHPHPNQENIKNCVVIIYDPSRTRTTGLALRAFRLTDTFMALYKVAP